MHVPPPERKKGQVVAGRFRLVDQIGRGGMGGDGRRITSLKVDVAVKFMTARSTSATSRCSRFQKEATAAASIRARTSKILDTARTNPGGRTRDGLLKGEELEQRSSAKGRPRWLMKR
jgi:hypothetical protein